MPTLVSGEAALRAHPAAFGGALAVALRRPFVGALAVYLALPLTAVGALLAAAVVLGLVLRFAFALQAAPPWTDTLADAVGMWMGHALVAWFVQAPLPLALAALVRRAWMWETARQARSSRD